MSGPNLQFVVVVGVGGGVGVGVGCVGGLVVVFDGCAVVHVGDDGCGVVAAVVGWVRNKNLHAIELNDKQQQQQQ
jgi:hypothetical protein